MSKKTEPLKYMQSAIPNAQSSYKTVKLNWSGFNARNEFDTGELSAEKNISTAQSPYLTPSPKPHYINDGDIEGYPSYNNPVGLFGFDGFLIVVYHENGKTWLDYLVLDDTGLISEKYTGLVSNSADIKAQRSMVQFNVYSSVNNAVDGAYIKKLLLFPDKVSMYMDIRRVENEEFDTTMSSPYDHDVMWTDGSYYWIWNDKTGFEACGGKGYFICDGLTVDIKPYVRNFEYELTTDSYYYAANDKNYYKKTTTDDGGETTYTPADNLSDGDSVNGLYEHTCKPPKGCDTSAYYQNKSTATGAEKKIFRYAANYDGHGNTGWVETQAPSFPPIEYATVHLSRLFGVGNGKVYVSGFNDYTNWNLDTVSDTNASNAWCSAAQSNTHANGSFTGIVTYDSHVVCFKEDYMHEIYNTKNPFRLQDIYAEGAIDNRTIAECGGKLFFVSSDDVKMYTGAAPRIVGYKLGIDRFDKACAGSDERMYYLYCHTAMLNEYESTKYKNISRLFVYDTYVGEWSERDMGDNKILQFAHNKKGMYALTDEGSIAKLDTTDYDHDWSFETDMRMTAANSRGSTVSIKHLRKIQLHAWFASNSRMKIYALYDDEKFNADTSHLLYNGSKKGDRAIRVTPRMTAHHSLKLHIEGHGYIKLYGLEMSFVQGGDLYVGN